MINWYPPYLGAGIKVTDANDTLTRFEVSMKQTRWNTNIVGVHFGGSLYSMCDPFFMWILMENLGKDYVVWDKAASIRFRRPGRGTVKATFEISPEVIQAIREEIDQVGKKDYHFHAVITDETGTIVAEVEKVVYVRKK
jgi:acyl-coenzyme A thioesterase PaaI-like protein